MTSPPTSLTAVECAVCKQQSVHPVKLPCTHIFCFLCIKGAAFYNRMCPLCRASVPFSYFNDPELVDSLEPEDTDELNDGYQWFYQGAQGWWQYEVRTARELETSYKADDPNCSISVSGLNYLVDFQQMVQVRKDHTGRRRKVKRDLAHVEKKGIAGIKMDSMLTAKKIPAPAVDEAGNGHRLLPFPPQPPQEGATSLSAEREDEAPSSVCEDVVETARELRHRRRRRVDPSPTRDLSVDLADLSLSRSSRV